MSELAEGMSIGQVADRTGLSVHALRFYEREGILPNPVRRGPGGRRVYSEDDLEWLDLCIMLRSSGMPLPAIRQYTDLVRQGPGNEAERLDLARLAAEGKLKVFVTQTFPLAEAAAAHRAIMTGHATGKIALLP